MSSVLTGETIGEALVRVTRALSEAHIEHAGGDARRLIAAALDTDSLTLIRDPGRVVEPAEQARLSDMTRRRLAREPVSRVIGQREFYGRSFAISPDVLDPRADTETVVETALAICRDEGWREGPLRILDLGTGSGAILMTLLAELPQATGTGIDVSEGALAVARRNADALGVAARCTLAVGNMGRFDPKGFNLVVANPPYIPTGEIAGLAPEVTAYDPHLALDGGKDGLDFYRLILAAIVPQADGATTPQWLVLEAGAGQASAIVEIAQKMDISCEGGGLIQRRDLTGTTRCVAFRTRS